MKDYNLISGGVNMYYDSQFEVYFRKLIKETKNTKRKQKINKIFNS